MSSQEHDAVQDAMTIRRELVSELRLQGLSIRQIARALEARGVVNPHNNAAYSAQTIKKDLDVLREQWREAAQQDFSDHVARQLAELLQVKRAAWSEGRLNAVMRALELEMRLLGTAQPEKLSVSSQALLKGYVIVSPDDWDVKP